MDIPNLPTDNLYKFIALFGLILTLSTLYLDSEARKELTLLYNQQLNVGFENLAGDIDRANENKIKIVSIKYIK